MLPPNTTFSQSGLDDWQRCPRLFLLRHIERRLYPAPETNDMLAFEAHMERGADFHHLAHQHFSGIDAATLAGRITDPQLATWWDAFLTHALPTISKRRYAEAPLTAPINGHRLLAKYDLIAVDAENRKITIYDWKTSLRRPARATLERRAQTMVYRYLMVRAGAYYLDWSPVEPEQVEMIYWFAEFPTEPERFPYSGAQFAQDEETLAGLITDIEAEHEFPKVLEADKDRICRYCVYRTLCWDDVQAGPFEGLFEDEAPTETEPEPDAFELDFDQIQEVTF